MKESKGEESNFSCCDINAESAGGVDGFKPFCFDGVLVAGDEHSKGVVVKLMRDTGSSQSLVVRGAVPGLEDCLTNDKVIVRSIGGLTSLPRARVHLDCGIFKGDIIVGIVESLPIPGVDVLVGNDAAGNRVVPDPVVCDTPLEVSPVQQLEDVERDLFLSCVVERSRGLRGIVLTESVPSIDDQFNSVECGARSAVEDDKPLFKNALTEKESMAESTCYYLKAGVLMRKYRASTAVATASWEVKHQLVVPATLKNDVMRVAHEVSTTHLGIKKTAYSILQYFYWPSLLRDVKVFCNCCITCQKVGKPNQAPKPVPLVPQVVCNVPFEKVIIDCVGPLPKTKRQHQYMLTIMCSSIRYPDAIPLRNITTKNLIPHLVKFFTQYGIPKVVQTDRGTNFTSKLFQDVMLAMRVHHSISTAYHPQSQGALEQFHQTLKEALTKYSHEHQKEWDEGLPFVLFAIRNTQQESLGYSPSELLYGRSVRGPLKVLYDVWLENQESGKDLHQYAVTLKKQLDEARVFAHQNLLKAQKSMKKRFDVKTVTREFKPGDQILMLNPTKKSLECRFEGPYTVVERRCNNVYEIETTGKRKDRHLVHVNRLKPFVSKSTKVKPTVLAVVNVKNDLVIVPENDFKIGNDSHLSNSEVLMDISAKLLHLGSHQAKDVESLLKSQRSMWRCTNPNKSFGIYDHFERGNNAMQASTL
ncbi:uncharacterized protein LOC135213249 [Macrobrachium nipponense]|uniref:uncharacterized protein LOC135213249 n=1 Tax=Macrobrachium nipponense TaxID=159736 RepID=UPI0030C84498